MKDIQNKTRKETRKQTFNQKVEMANEKKRDRISKKEKLRLAPGTNAVSERPKSNNFGWVDRSTKRRLRNATKVNKDEGEN